MKKAESKYPMMLVDACKVRLVQMVETKEDEELYDKYHTFIKLVETCKEWNRIDGFEAEWQSSLQNKSVIKFCDGRLIIDTWCHFSEPLHFKDRETAELFLETFREEIELVKDLI